MKWTQVTDSDKVRPLRELLIRKLVALAALFGYRLVPIDFEISLLQKASVTACQHGSISVIVSPEVKIK